MRVTEIDDTTSTRVEEEVARWEIHHSKEELELHCVYGDSDVPPQYLRISQRDPGWASTFIALFSETDPKGTERYAINLGPEQLQELIDDLIEAKHVILQRARDEGYDTGAVDFFKRP